ncbi:MAG: hypothetical protein ACE5GN_07205 [Waddliaceae bacterium]
MKKFRKKIYIAAGYNTTYMGTGRKECNPKKPLRGFEDYLKETGEGTSSQVLNPNFDEGIIGSFMSGRFLNQANLPGFLPFMVPSLAEREVVPLLRVSALSSQTWPTAFLWWDLKCKIP